MVDKRIRGMIATFLELPETSGHTLVVGHRNVNKMIIRNLLGLSLEEGYEVEHKNSGLYIYAPKKAEIFLTHIPSPLEPIEVLTGYEKIEMTLDR